ncbi:hypothetical protein [Nocardioides sp.]|uniref:hypothetical protein n=1 Tax=Nocardioides sp. TaxID=35761 RepID=UPI002ED3F570
MSRRSPLLPMLLAALVTAAAVGQLGAGVARAHVTESAIEDYADYVPQQRCRPKAKPGTKALGRWIVRTQGGGSGGISRSCKYGGTSEHKEGRAFDWTLDATRKKDRRTATGFLRLVRATDKAGNSDARARRMGIMYVIWNDHMYSAWDGFEREPYLASSCPSKRKCSKSARHRNHMHISLSRPGGRGRTSWYDGRLD